jgi:hypothetical protein
VSAPMASSSRPTVREHGSRRTLVWPICWCLMGACLIAGPAVRFTGTSEFAPPPRASAPFFSSKPASTTVAPNPKKAIEDVRIGDWVLARDLESKRLVARRVVKTHRRVSNHLRILRIRASDGTEQELRTTDEHPFWVPGEGWLQAGKLKVGSGLLRYDGAPAIVRAAWRESYPNGVPVYNFEVEGQHNYFVAEHASSGAVLVHNQHYTEDQQALQQLVNEATLQGRRPLTVEQANTVLDWAEEIGYPGVRAGPADVGAPNVRPNWVGGPHINIPGIGRNGHVPVMPGVPAR